MSNIINFPSSARRELACESDMLNARDHLLELVARLDELKAELSVLVQKQDGQESPQGSLEEEHPWLAQCVDDHRSERTERQVGGT
jgi:hypothetical protein